MFHVFLHRLLPAAFALVGAAAAAQPASPARPAKADPLDHAASAPAAIYRSALAGYQRHADQPVGSWRQANDTVTRVGGWRAYAREAAQPAAAAASAAPSHAPAGPAGHQH